MGILKTNFKISIALCACNGELFLAQQLDSIVGQTTLPDEIVLFDDASEDRTVEIAKRYANILPLQIEENKERLGVSANFSNAINACTGDIIFLCDQDDIWEPHKIEKILRSFKLNKNIGLIFSNASLIDEESRISGKLLWDVNRFSYSSRRKFASGNALSHLLRSNIVTGATVAFRSDFKDVILPVPINWIHDYWIATLISAIAPIHLEDSPLVRYRLHAAQQIGVHRNILGKLITLANRKTDSQIEEAKYIELRSRIKNYAAIHSLSEDIIELLDKKLSHIAARGSVSSGVRIGGAQMLSEILRGNYSKFSYGWLDIVSDIKRMFH